MIKCIIVEDEYLARQKLELFATKHADLALAGSYASAEDFLALENISDIDLLLLDIGLPNIDGISLAHRLAENCRVIFTTAYAEYAVEAFNLSATDYLLKPFDFQRFSEAIKKVYSQHPKKTMFDVGQSKILVKEGRKIHHITTDSIFFIKGLKEYVVWHTGKGKLVTLHSLSHLKNYLEPFDFIQTHRSYIVNAQKVSKVEYRFVYVNQQQIPIGRSFREAVKKKFQTDI